MIVYRVIVNERNTDSCCDEALVIATLEELWRREVDGVAAPLICDK